MKKVITIFITLTLVSLLFIGCSNETKERAARYDLNNTISESLYNDLSAYMKAALNNNPDNIKVTVSEEGKLSITATLFEECTIPLMADELYPGIQQVQDENKTLTTLKLTIITREGDTYWISEDGKTGDFTKSSKTGYPHQDFGCTTDDLKEYFKSDLEKYYETQNEISEIWSNANNN